MLTRIAPLLLVVTASALRLAPVLQPRTATPLMQQVGEQQDAAVANVASLDGKVVATGAEPEGWQLVVENARTRAAAVKGGQDETTAAMATGTIALFALSTTLIDNLFADLLLSSVVGGLGAGYLAGFQEGFVGDGARGVGRAVVTVTSKASDALDSTGLPQKIQSSLPGGGGEGLSMTDIKKYGVAGTLAYILTELAFWIVAFPVASATFYNTAGHWPDFADGSDRTAVLAFIFAGANVARLAVPLRFGAAFALAPWVDENIVQKFGGGGDSKEE